jgi:Zn-dependent peptidase ImmA (M78 family)
MAARTKFARREARRLCETYGVAAPPVAVDRIAKSLGIQVRYAPFDEPLSGISCIKDGIAIIGVNSLHIPPRQRFTLAHELAHIQLHRTLLENQVHVDTGTLRLSIPMKAFAPITGVGEMEIEANAFASELLMPHSLLHAALTGRAGDLEDDEMIETLARRFRVTEAALRFRLQAP